jgi:cobyrinic acid a,c-diamide synthase
VIINQVASERHGNVARSAIEEITGIPVIGMIPRLPESFVLPSRHLGLITPDEFEQKSVILEDLRKVIEEYVDTSKILEIASNSPLLEDEEPEDYNQEFSPVKEKVKIGYYKDQAFSFYYPENLERLSAAGAELIPISAIHNSDLEKLDTLYIGGGFPETNLANLTLNHKMMASLKQLAEDGLPIYAECGGLIYLAEDIEWKGREYELSGILPIKIRMHDKPQGHGYCEATVDDDNPFYEKGIHLKGHEFHYSKIYEYNQDLKSSLSISRGVGCFNNRDGLIYKNVFASYIHIHASATPEWVEGMIKCAGNYQALKKTKIFIEG